MVAKKERQDYCEESVMSSICMRPKNFSNSQDRWKNQMIFHITMVSVVHSNESVESRIKL